MGITPFPSEERVGDYRKMSGESRRFKTSGKGNDRKEREVGTDGETVRRKEGGTDGKTVRRKEGETNRKIVRGDVRRRTDEHSRCKPTYAEVVKNVVRVEERRKKAWT